MKKKQNKVKVSRLLGAAGTGTIQPADTFIRGNNRERWSLAVVGCYLVEDRHQLAPLHGQIVLVLAVVAVQHDELPVGVLEEGVDLRLGGGLGEQGAAAGLAAAHIELQTGVLEAVCVTLLQPLVH